MLMLSHHSGFGDVIAIGGARVNPSGLVDDSGDASVMARISIDTRMEEYSDLLPAEWPGRLTRLLERHPTYATSGNRLLFQWRAITRVADFPATMVALFGGFAAGILEKHPVKDRTKKIAGYFSDAFREAAGRLSRHNLFSVALRSAEEATHQKLAAALHVGEKAALETVTPSKIWERFIEEKDFRFRIWSSMQAACVAAYNAYDGFLQESAPGDDWLNRRVKEKYGDDLFRKAFQGRDIQIARKARHALAHNRSLLTDDLRAMSHGLHVEDDLISIHPADLRRFLTAMAEGASEIISSGR